jgi:dienelactone hydrolase
MMSAEREKVRFASGGIDCAAWHYPGSSGGCVIMAGGFAVTKEPATDLFARRFHDAGFTVLAFDYRGIGESGGQPRQVQRVRDQLDDWQAAVTFAATLPGVDPARLAIWGFSASGGHVFRVAARNPQLAAAIAQTPTADALAVARNAALYQTPSAMLRFAGRGILDALGALAGRPPLLVPLAGQMGAVAMLTTPDALDGDSALNPGNKYPGWQQEVAARSALRLGFYRPGRKAARVRCPLLVLVCGQDLTALAGQAARAANRAPRGELFRMPGGHYAPFLKGHEKAVAAELSFLRRHLLEPSPADQAAHAASTLPAARQQLLQRAFQYWRNVDHRRPDRKGRPRREILTGRLARVSRARHQLVPAPSIRDPRCRHGGHRASSDRSTCF